MHHDRCLPGPGNRPTSLRATAHQVTGLEKPLSGWGRDLPPWWSFEPVGIARRCLPTFSPHTSFPRLCLRFSIASRLPWACDPLVGGQRGSLHKPSVRRVHRDPLRVRVFARDQVSCPPAQVATPVLSTCPRRFITFAGPIQHLGHNLRRFRESQVGMLLLRPDGKKLPTPNIINFPSGSWLPCRACGPLAFPVST